MREHIRRKIEKAIMKALPGAGEMYGGENPTRLVDSVGESVVWGKTKATECGYRTKGDTGCIGVIGMEDFGCIWDLTPGGAYGASELVQEELQKVIPGAWLEPYYSFLWCIRID